MATVTKVQDVVVRMATATNHRFFGEKEEAQTVATYLDALEGFSNEAVDTAGGEWADTMPKFPTLVEFVTLVRSVQVRINDAVEAERLARALEAGVGGGAPMDRYPIGREGQRGLATEIVIKRMMRAVSDAVPKSLWGGEGRSASLREAGHTFDVVGQHEPAGLGQGHCERCQLIATLAFEQAVEFEGSTVTWDAWERQGDLIDLDRLRRCINSACDHGWVPVLTIEDGRLVERLKKCETCGGPQPKTPRPKVMDGEEMVTVTRQRRRRVH